VSEDITFLYEDMAAVMGTVTWCEFLVHLSFIAFTRNPLALSKHDIVAYINQRIALFCVYKIKR